MGGKRALQQVTSGQTDPKIEESQIQPQMPLGQRPDASLVRIFKAQHGCDHLPA